VFTVSRLLTNVHIDNHFVKPRDAESKKHDSNREFNGHIRKNICRLATPPPFKSYGEFTGG
jgi:hypothetical protein